MSGIALTTCAIGLCGITPEAFVERAERVMYECINQQQFAEETVEGEIVKIQEDYARFILQPKAEDEDKLVLAVNEETAYVLDDEPSTRAEALVVGRRAIVVHENKVASRVAVYTE